MSYIHRNLIDKLEATIKSFSAVYLSGARQCGKSTFVQNFSEQSDIQYITFDTTAIRLAAKKDPDAFISSLVKDSLSKDKTIIIDEVQRVPEIFIQLKELVDKKRTVNLKQGITGKAFFLLTGSANIFALPHLAQTMVGRMAVLNLNPFSAAEINKSTENFIKKIWEGNLSVKNYNRADLVQIIKNSTFPEIALNSDIDRSIWMDSYFNTILDRDAVEFANIKKPEMIYQLLVSIGNRVGSLINNDNIMKETGFNQITYEKYKSFCNACFLTFEVQPWAKPNKLDKRFVKSKKMYFTDTNFLCYLLRRDITEVHERDKPLMGHLFENFIASEIIKAISTLPGKYYVSHFNPVRGDGKETDFVIEKDNGDTIAIEVKLDSSFNDSDFKNLELCRNTIGEKFKTGVVLYTGEQLVPFGEKLWAVPVNYLWEQ